MGDLSAAQIAAVRKTWDMVRPNYKNLGAEFFGVFFAKHPEYKAKFVNLQNIPDSQLAASTEAKGHGVRVLSALSSYIDNLDDKPVLLDLLRKNGRDHIARGLTPQHYTNILNCLIAFLEQKLGSACDANAKSAWQATTAMFVGVLGEGLKG